MLAKMDGASQHHPTYLIPVFPSFMFMLISYFLLFM